MKIARDVANQDVGNFAVGITSGKHGFFRVVSFNRGSLPNQIENKKLKLFWNGSALHDLSEDASQVLAVVSDFDFGHIAGWFVIA